MDPLAIINKSFGTYNVRGWSIEPTYWQAGAITLCLFMLLFTLARLRHMYVHWSVSKPSISFIFWGFLLALIVEGILFISGRTIFTELLGWKDAPKPISTVLDKSRSELITVLGVSETVPESYAEVVPTYQSVVIDFTELSDEEKETFKKFLCE